MAGAQSGGSTGSAQKQRRRKPMQEPAGEGSGQSASAGDGECLVTAATTTSEILTWEPEGAVQVRDWMLDAAV